MSYLSTSTEESYQRLFDADRPIGRSITVGEVIRGWQRKPENREQAIKFAFEWAVASEK